MMRLSRCFVRIATAATVLMAACTFAAGTAQAISGGTESSDPNGLRRHVVRIVGSDGRVCSGTIIGPTKIITAAHCFTSADPSRYRIMVLDHRFNEHWMSVAAIRVHPKFGLQRFGAADPAQRHRGGEGRIAPALRYGGGSAIRPVRSWAR